ncbi:hypothetical protein LTV02_13370 [Nocardia yamanashiensis]|uniref:hypothetical protein n=1 Tax=Nocardia yamanashiensis TaxID=209247 RepID=UPI001E4E012F|nr:hypothetical protein [Nocardia yamanashiensis]UGT44317.1 hypothetical protein LTV02_13370 [Nocardia yamanashiensis]
MTTAERSVVISGSTFLRSGQRSDLTANVIGPEGPVEGNFSYRWILPNIPELQAVPKTALEARRLNIDVPHLSHAYEGETLRVDVYDDEGKPIGSGTKATMVFSPD